LVAEQLSNLYKNYIQAFSALNMEAVSHCYQLPCILSTPDKVVLLNNHDEFVTEFNNIFELVRSENIVAFKTSNASFDIINEGLLVVAIDWRFFDDANNLFTEFTAIYHLTSIDENYKIVNVISQDVSQSIALKYPLTITLE